MERYKDFLEFAIKSEKEAAALYENTASVVNAAAQKQLLKELAKMERGHEVRLRAFLSGPRGSFITAVEQSDLKISDFLVTVTIGPDSPLEDVFIFAMKAEQKAYDFYTSLAELEVDDTVRKLFLQLASEEKKHKFDLEVEFETKFWQEN